MTNRRRSALIMAVVLATGLPGALRASVDPRPSAPTDLVAAAGDGFAVLRWTPPVEVGESVDGEPPPPITSYLINNYSGGTIYFSGEVFPTGNELTLGESQWVFNTLEVSFGLIACNSFGCGPESEPSNAVLPQEGAVPPQLQLATVPPEGGMAATDADAVEPSASNPVITSVTVPPTLEGGTLSIAETTVSEAPTGYTFLGQDIVIESTAPTDAQNPLSITFRVDPAQVPVTIFRNGVPITEACTTPGIAEPTPCIADGDGTAAITILTAAASTWNVGLADYVFEGFSSPVDDLPVANLAQAGRAIPVRFGLGGDRGLNVLAGGSPRSYGVACDGEAAFDGVEETVAASSQLAYSVGTGLYQLGWNTERSWAGSCRELVLTFRDGTEARARFAFR